MLKWLSGCGRDGRGRIAQWYELREARDQDGRSFGAHEDNRAAEFGRYCGARR